ncbi:MAG: 4Fe-4S binding protein [candidate division WS1 bacterium]|jgi:ferredoxin|nr:4Fe-4S binding protein [candidate division WS1 bacterium]
MLTTESLRDYALNVLGVDKLGVANIERFDSAPDDMNPRFIMPKARSVIVYLKRIVRGTCRGVDEGTNWSSYHIFSYAGLGQMLGLAKDRLLRHIEQHGYDATPLSAVASSREFGPKAPPAAPGLPPREVVIQHRIAGTLAGLGEIGWSKVFLTKEFGPRQRLGVILTDAELEPDPIVTGELCDRCMRCVAECPAGAIDPDRSVGIEVEGHRIEWNDLDLGKCKLTHFGLNKLSGPFFAKRFPGVSFPVADQEVTWLEAWDMGWAMFPTMPALSALSASPVASCGARGCIIACMKHLETTGVLETKFRTAPGFSDGEPWRLDEKPGHLESDHKGFVWDPDKPEVEKPEPSDGKGWY